MHRFDLNAPSPPQRLTLVTAGNIRNIMLGAGVLADRYVDALNSAMTAYNIAKPAQRAAFLAQISVESGDLNDTEENLNYTAQRLMKVWPKRFPTLESAKSYANDPAALGNHIYGGRLGNGAEATGDGYRYRGRGLMQVTGRNNYRQLGFENRPEALAVPVTAADTAASFWCSQNLNARTEKVLERAPFHQVSRTVNGGDNGLEQRWTAYQRAIAVLRANG